MMRWPRVLVLALFAATFPGALPAAAVTAYDVPTVQVAQTAPSFMAMDVTAGPSGAPAGFYIDWMKKSDYDALGGWPSDNGTPGYAYCVFDGVPTLNMTSGVESFNLAPGQSVRVVLGDLFDETGVYTNYTDEMLASSQYVLRIRAEGDLNAGSSAFSQNYLLTTTAGNNCTFTVGYWKTHGAGACHSGTNLNTWPVSTLTLGTVSYTAAELCAILNTPAAGNGLISLAHQLIAAKLSIANGADATSIASTIAAADALIGSLVVPPIGGGFLSPGSTSGYTSTLTQYNNGLLGPTHCEETPATPATWGRLKTLYR
jgi:hypothetical protein